MTRPGRDFNKVRTLSFLFSHQGPQVPTKTGICAQQENKPWPKDPTICALLSFEQKEKKKKKGGGEINWDCEKDIKLS